MKFVLDPKLENDSSFICDLTLTQVRLSHNAAFAWIILIPRLPNMVELIDLSVSEQEQLLKEIRLASHIMRTLFQPTKLNVANLGNVVSQLHIHVIARFNTDLAWPQPVWNSGVHQEYMNSERQQRISLLVNAFMEP